VNGGLTEVPPPNLVMLRAEASAESVRFWRLPRALAEPMGMEGQPRGAASQRVGLHGRNAAGASRATLCNWRGGRSS
jgi:hypothetical protein